MKKIDEYQIGLAFAWLIIAFGSYALPFAAQSSIYEAVSSLALSVGFPVSAFAGFAYRFFPLMKQSKLAKPQFLFLNVGLGFMIVGAFLTGLGYMADIVKFGSVITMGGILMLTWIWWFDRVPKP